MSTAIGPDLAAEVREGTIKYLWRQWQSVGGAAATSGQANVIVDPEVLVLTSLLMLDQERRLGDVLESWIRLNSDLISIQRLSNLRGQFPKRVKERLGSLAAVGLAAKDSRWKALRSSGKGEDLGARGNKARAIQAPLRSWSTLMLQLRRGMGVGVKADLLAYLLGTNAATVEWANVASVAEETGYTVAAVRRAADDLAAASFLLVPPTGQGRSLQRMYAADPKPWVHLLRLSIHQPGWGYWRERFLFILAVLDWLGTLRQRKVTAYARDVEARELLTRHLPALQHDRVIDPLELSAAEFNSGFLESASLRLLNWIANRG
jgi:hypothetical protein